MNIYIDGKLHEDCVSCSNLYLNSADTYSCKLLREVVGANFSDCAGQRHKDCPYKSLSDYTKQVRKEVCEEIKQEVEKVILSKDLNLFGYKTLCKILDQIQGE